jgi:hypothetical protein
MVFVQQSTLYDNKEFAPFTNYTNLGFSETENLNAANYSNRRYSIIRNIYNYWQSYFNLQFILKIDL